VGERKRGRQDLVNWEATARKTAVNTVIHTTLAETPREIALETEHWSKSPRERALNIKKEH